MLIGGTRRGVAKLGEIKRLMVELEARKGMCQVYKEQVDSLMELNKQLISKLAALGIKVVVSKTGLAFESAGR